MDRPWTRLRREGSEGSKGSEGGGGGFAAKFKESTFLSSLVHPDLVPDLDPNPDPDPDLARGA